MSDNPVRESASISSNLETASMNLDMCVAAIRRAADEISTGDTTSDEVKIADALRQSAANLSILKFVVSVYAMAFDPKEEAN